MFEQISHPCHQAKKLLQEQLRISRTLTEKTMESESDEEVEEPAQGEGPEGDQDESDAYGSLLTSEDNPWRLDTRGTPHLTEALSSLDCGKFQLHHTAYCSFGVGVVLLLMSELGRVAGVGGREAGREGDWEG